MQYDPFRSSRDLGLTWPEVKLWPWPFKVILYMVLRALTRQTRWYQNRCSTVNIKDFIVDKPFWKILEFWPLETSILTWAKKWPKWFRNDFSRAFERCLSFFFTATRSRDHGGGRSNAPPSRRWKIQRPSRARVNKATSTYNLFISNFDISMTWGQVKILTSPLWVNGGNIEILPNASVRCNSFRIMCS